MNFFIEQIKELAEETISKIKLDKVLFRDTIGIYEPYGQIIRKPKFNKIAETTCKINTPFDQSFCFVGGEAWVTIKHSALISQDTSKKIGRDFMRIHVYSLKTFEIIENYDLKLSINLSHLHYCVVMNTQVTSDGVLWVEFKTLNQKNGKYLNLLIRILLRNRSVLTEETYNKFDHFDKFVYWTYNNWEMALNTVPQKIRPDHEFWGYNSKTATFGEKMQCIKNFTFKDRDLIRLYIESHNELLFLCPQKNLCITEINSNFATFLMKIDSKDDIVCVERNDGVLVVLFKSKDIVKSIKLIK